MAKLLEGKTVAGRMREELRRDCAAFAAATGRPPGLSVIQVGSDGASESYLRAREKAAQAAGFFSEVHALLADVKVAALQHLIERLNEDEAVDGILVQMPLPKALDANAVLEVLSPEKDVDGATDASLGRLLAGRPGLRPCTPKAVMTLLESYKVPLVGAHAVVVGRSLAVGRPMAALLLEADATVTVTHAKTRDLGSLTRQADVLVVAAGRRHLVGPDMVGAQAVVVDVGIHLTEEGLTGDVDPAAGEVVSALTPVPGGVGPVTTATLLQNTLWAARARLRLADGR